MQTMFDHAQKEKKMLEQTISSDKNNFDMLKLTHETQKEKLSITAMDLDLTYKTLAAKKDELVAIKSETQQEIQALQYSRKNIEKELICYQKSSQSLQHVNESLQQELRKVSDINHKLQNEHSANNNAFYSLTNNIKNIESEFTLSKQTIISLKNELDNVNRIKENNEMFKEKTDDEHNEERKIFNFEKESLKNLQVDYYKISGLYNNLKSDINSQININNDQEMS